MTRTDGPLQSSLPKQTRLLLAIFAAAVAIRWTYGVILFATMGQDGVMGMDSYAYLVHARTFAGKLLSGSLQGWDWLGMHTQFMPLFTWLLTLNVIVAGAWAPISYICMQGALDAGTCLLVYGIAQAIDSRAALPAAIVAMLNPTQIVLSGLVYTDTPFVFFVALSLLGAIQWLRWPSWRWAIIAGLGLGAAALCRVLIVPWVVIVALFLFVIAWRRGMLRLAQLGQIAIVGSILVVCVAPVLLRNISQYGAFAFTTQSGKHLALWVVPLVQEAKDGTPWAKGVEQMQKRQLDRFGKDTRNPFESSRQNVELAREALRSLGFPAIVKAWIIGAAINLGSPAIILSPPVARLPRTGFYATQGATIVGKVITFLFRSDSGRYALLLIAGIAGVAVMRLIQLAGFVALFRHGDNPAGVLLLAVWCLFILFVNGPVASPKYRLPLEPPLMVFAGAGVVALRRTKSAPA